MKNFFKKKLKNNKFLYNFFSTINFYSRGLYISFFMTIFKIFKIKDNRIVIISYYGKGYGDNGKYITEKLLENDCDCEILWAVKNSSFAANLPQKVKSVKFNSIKYFFYLTTAKVWINNTRFLNGTKKRKKQFYIQVWHGNLALKKIEYDAVLPKNYVKIMNHDNKLIDLMISNSDFCTNMYRNSFKFNGKIELFGTPRNDVFINEDYIRKAKKNVYTQYKIKENTKIILYAPTFRDDYSHNPYDIDFEILKKNLTMNTNDEWVIMLRFHPLVVDGNKYINSKDYIDVTNYPDMQELINSSSLVITDYSSVMFDSLIAKKPVLLYANDIEKYNTERGYYFSFDDLPFPLFKNNEELAKKIKNINSKNIMEKYDDFSKKVNLFEDGNASIRTSKLITKLLEGDCFDQ